MIKILLCSLLAAGTAYRDAGNPEDKMDPDVDEIENPGNTRDSLALGHYLTLPTDSVYAEQARKEVVAALKANCSDRDIHVHLLNAASKVDSGTRIWLDVELAQDTIHRMEVQFFPGYWGDMGDASLKSIHWPVAAESGLCKLLDSNSTDSGLKSFVQLSPEESDALRNAVWSKVPVMSLAEIHQGADVPQEYDQRTKKPECFPASLVPDQGSCGSCWAFAALGALGDRHCIANPATMIKNGHRQTLSVQQMLSCHVRDGCNGKFMDTAFSAIVNKGVKMAFTEDYPYAARCFEDRGGVVQQWGGVECWMVQNLPDEDPGKPCSCVSRRMDQQPYCDHGMANRGHLTLDDYKMIPKPFARKDMWHAGAWSGQEIVNAIMGEIVTSGPVAVGFQTFEDFQMHTDRSPTTVYEHQHGYHRVGGHAAVMVGFGNDRLMAKPYWILRNSWGKVFGDRGHWKHIRGKNDCDIEGAVSVAIIRPPERPPAPPVPDSHRPDPFEPRPPVNPPPVRPDPHRPDPPFRPDPHRPDPQFRPDPLRPKPFEPKPPFNPPFNPDGARTFKLENPKVTDFKARGVMQQPNIVEHVVGWITGEEPETRYGYDREIYELTVTCSFECQARSAVLLNHYLATDSSATNGRCCCDAEHYRPRKCSWLFDSELPRDWFLQPTCGVHDLGRGRTWTWDGSWDPQCHNERQDRETRSGTFIRFANHGRYTLVAEIDLTDFPDAKGKVQVLLQADRVDGYHRGHPKAQQTYDVEIFSYRGTATGEAGSVGQATEVFDLIDVEVLYEYKSEPFEVVEDGVKYWQVRQVPQVHLVVLCSIPCRPAASFRDLDVSKLANPDSVFFDVGESLYGEKISWTLTSNIMDLPPGPQNVLVHVYPLDRQEHEFPRRMLTLDIPHVSDAEPEESTLKLLELTTSYEEKESGQSLQTVTAHCNMPCQITGLIKNGQAMKFEGELAEGTSSLVTYQVRGKKGFIKRSSLAYLTLISTEARDNGHQELAYCVRMTERDTGKLELVGSTNAEDVRSLAIHPACQKL